MVPRPGWEIANGQRLFYQQQLIGVVATSPQLIAHYRALRSTHQTLRFNQTRAKVNAFTMSMASRKMSVTWESTLGQIEEKLLTLPAVELCDLCTMLELPISEEDKHLPRKMRRIILQYLEGEDVISLEDEGMSLLLKVGDRIEELKTATPSGSAKQEPPLLDGAGTAHTNGSGSSAPGTAANVNAPVYNASPAFVHQLYRKDFKIVGQIGEAHQKDKLGYTSLERQIEKALKKGYSEADIVEAVIQAIAPGIKLKSYLESRLDLSLQALRQILRTHFIEKDATELYHSLTRAAQDSRETPIQFLMRAMDLRQQILFASERAETGLKYSAELIQNQFLQTVLTGLIDDTVRTDLKPYLRDPSVSDEVLLEKVTDAYTLEMERKNKLASISRSRGARVAAVGEDYNSRESSTMASTTTKPSEPPKRETLLEKVDQGNKAICEAIQQLTTQLSTLHQAPRPSPSERPSRPPNQKFRPQHRSQHRPSMSRRCQRCQTTNPQGKCDHCYKCGSSDHWAIGCRKATNFSASTNKIETKVHLGKTDAQFNQTTPLTSKQRQTAKLVGRRCLV